MQSHFQSNFFADNRRALCEQVGADATIVITANGQLQASGDNPFPFQQDTSFWYLTGIEQPDYTLVINKHEAYLIAPARSEVQDMFDGTVDHEMLAAHSGIAAILSQREGWTRLASDLKTAKQVHTLTANPAYIAVYGMYTNPARSRLIRRLKRTVLDLGLVDIRPQLADLRVVKQASEIESIRKAVAINCDTINEVASNLYRYEYELEADITRGFRARGGRGHAFSPIVAGGLRACTFHYEENAARLQLDELVLIDTGVKYGQYASDITRTWSLAKPSERQRAIYSAVSDALDFGIAQLKPGPSFYDCEQQIRAFVGQKLKDLGLLKRVDQAGTARYYPHAPHYLGLDVHDVGNTRRPLEPGMVLTLEPGIYIPEEQIGVRLEEDILITENGCEVLSKSCPRKLTPVQ